jgi:predicted nucleotidyltransferase
MSPGLTEVQEAALVAEVRSHPEILAAWVHGSRVKGNFRPESDLDLAILVRPAQRDCFAWLDLTSRLREALGLDVHLGRMGTDLPVFAREVIAHGRLLFSRDRYQTEMFVATALGVYARFQEDRQEVLRAYRLPA